MMLLKKNAEPLIRNLLLPFIRQMGNYLIKPELSYRKCCWKEKKYKEVAEECKVSVNTVKTLLNIGLRQLRSNFPNSMVLLILIKVALNVKNKQKSFTHFPVGLSVLANQTVKV